MHLIGALLLAAVIGAFTLSFLGRASRRVADHGTPAAQRVAKGGRRAAAKGGKAAQRGVAEIWAEVRAADWLERRNIARARRAARPGAAAATGRGIAATGRGLGRGVRATGRGAARAGRAVRSRVPVTIVVEPGKAARDAVIPAGRCAGCGVPPGTACLDNCWCPACESHKGPPPFLAQPRGDDRNASRPPISADKEPHPMPTGTVPQNTNGASPAPGGGADMFTAIQQVTGHAMSGGLRSKQRSFKVLEDSFDYISQQLATFARQLAEPGQEYPASIWEPLAKAAAHLKAAASAAGESSSGIGALAAMPMGEAADSPVHVPHNTQLNAPR